MVNQPLTGAARSKVGFFVALMLPAIVFFGVGLVPALVLLWGWFMMRRARDFAYVRSSVTVVKGLLLLVTAGCVIAALVNVFIFSNVQPDSSGWDYQREHLEHAVFSALLGCIPLAYLLALHHLYLKPLGLHGEWVERHGIFASKSKEATNDDVDIIKGERLKSYSVADELLKWAALKDQGHITKDEFNEARRKLLQKA